MADHRGSVILKKFEAGRPVSQPADVFKCPAKCSVTVAHLSDVQRPAERLNECKYETFRSRRLQIGKSSGLGEVSNEKTKRAFAANRLKPERKTAQTACALNSCAVTAQIWRGEGSYPLKWESFAGQGCSAALKWIAVGRLDGGGNPLAKADRIHRRALGEALEHSHLSGEHVAFVNGS